MTSATNDIDIEEFLFHVKRTIIDYHEDKSGATRTTDILGTYTSLPAAKSFARVALKNEGYDPDDFSVYEEKKGDVEWKHGDGVLIFAKAAAGQEFEVRLDTKPNIDNLTGNEKGKVEDKLHYVLQTKIAYNNDRVGGIQTTEVEGTYLLRKDAVAAAYNTLLDVDGGITKEWYAEYDEWDEQDDDWPYGEDTLVHAVGSTGENFLAQVKVQPEPQVNQAEKQDP